MNLEIQIPKSSFICVLQMKNIEKIRYVKNYFHLIILHPQKASLSTSIVQQVTSIISNI